MKRSLLLSILLLSLSCGLSFAQPIYSSGHGDIGLEYDSLDGFEPHWHLGSGAIVDGNPLAVGEEYAPDALIARASTTYTTITGMSSTLGVADGSHVYAFGRGALQPDVGLSTEEIDPADWTGDISIELTHWVLPSGTADFALFGTNSTATTVFERLFSTHAPGSTDNSNTLVLPVGVHEHFLWTFTETGTYELEFTFSGTHNVDGLITATETFTIQIIPEPSTAMLLVVGGIGAWMIRRKRGTATAI